MKKRISAFLLAAALLLCTAACAPAADTDSGKEPSPGTAPENSAETVEFLDDLGREVTVPADITRIVSTGPLSQIALFAIAPEMFVGLTSKWEDSAIGIIDEEYLNLPYFGQLYGSADLNIEELAVADPQLIIDIGEPKSGIEEDLNTLQDQTTIPSVYVSATLSTMADAYRTLGKLLGKEDKGEELAQFCERVYARTVSIMEQVGDNKVNALFVTGEKGLNVLAAGSYHAELIDMLTNNLAVVDDPSSRGTGNEVSMEQIALWNPDFVIFSPDSIYSSVQDDAAWSQITAIQNGDYIEVPNAPLNWMGSPPSVQRYLGMIWVPAVLYPEYCDYDVKAEVMEYYELFYGCTLTDEQYNTLTANAFIE